MSLNQDPPEITLPSRKCRHLGLFEDSQTWSATEQLQNFCHAGKRPKLVDWQHQCEYCFTDSYTGCPVLSFPKKTNKQYIFLPSISIRLSVGVILLVVLLGFTAYMVFWKGFPPLYRTAEATTRETPSIVLLPESGAQPNASVVLVPPTANAEEEPGSEPSPTSVILQMSAASATPTLTSTSKPTATTASTAADLPPKGSTITVVATSTPGPALETPFGPQNRYLVHQVSSGEYWERLARIYNTTEDVLRAVNGMDRTDPLLVDRFIVVFPGVKDATDVQPRQAIYLTAETDLQTLVEQFRVSEEQLRADNGLNESGTIPGQRWIVVPLLP